MPNDSQYDIVIIGSGIAGSMLGMVLSRVGLAVLVLEKNSHPRFAIGESTVPTTTMLFNFLSAEYGIPELADVGHYLGLRTAPPGPSTSFGMAATRRASRSPVSIS